VSITTPGAMTRVRKVTLAAAAVTAVVAAVPATAYATGDGHPARTAHPVGAGQAAGAGHAVGAGHVKSHPVGTAHAKSRPHTVPVAQRIGSGSMDDGQAWLVTLVYYPQVPVDFVDQYGGSVPAGDSLLCQRVVIGGVQVDAQGGDWADCDLVDNSATPDVSAGLWGNTAKGTSGDRVFVGHPEASVTRAVVELNDHNERGAKVVTVPGTDYRAYAVAISNGETIAAVDEYDAAGHLVDRQTDWQ
jgi:hypothetical protein